MARFCVVLFMLLFVLLSSCTQGRKLTSTAPETSLKVVPASPSLEQMRLYLNALPKGKVPASAPSKKGHSVTTDEKLIARHLAAIDRILRSVPSPGVGN